MVKIQYKDFNELVPYENNPRFNDNAVESVANSIKEFGFINPVIIDSNNVIIAGHTRYKACSKLGITQIPVIVASDLTPEQIRAFRLADNKTGELADWDMDKLQKELLELEFAIDMSEFGFVDESEFEDVSADDFDDGPTWGEMDKSRNQLASRFIIPPFSILNAQTKTWQDRKKLWIESGIRSLEGRDANLIGGFGDIAKRVGQDMTLKGTSIFDPVLVELVYKWFNVDSGSVFDPFAGGSVRGIIAEYLGYSYTGIDLRQSQIDANYENAREWGLKPKWVCDDSLNADKYVDDGSVDLMFTCPPYGDLEQYSDDERDLSNMNPEEFNETYSEILRIAGRKVKDNRFAVVVISDIRNKNGFYSGLVETTKNAMRDSGFELYNDIILYNSLGTAPFRVNGQFPNYRKVVRVHQNVLVFYKGDTKQIKNEFGELDLSDYTESEMNQ